MRVCVHCFPHIQGLLRFDQKKEKKKVKKRNETLVLLSAAADRPVLQNRGPSANLPGCKGKKSRSVTNGNLRRAGVA